MPIDIDLDFAHEQEEKNDSLDLMQLIPKWAALKSQLERVKKEEMDLRILICQLMINDDPYKPLTGPAIVKGEIAGFKVRASANVTTKFDFDEYDRMMAEGSLTTEEAAVVVNKPQLDKRALNKLEEDSIVRNAVYEVPAAPTLSAEEL